MNEKHITFGYFPHQCDVRVGCISLTDLPGNECTFAELEKSEGIYRDWIYAPAQSVRDFMSDRVEELPYRSRIFGLPKTHVLTHGEPDSIEHLDFLVWCISFFEGIRLTTTDAGFLDATPITSGVLNDFLLLNRNLPDVISLSETFWQKYSYDQRKATLVIGIIHTLFLSQNPHHLDFERFMYLYTALDACFALTESIYGPLKAKSHAARILRICEKFGMDTPDWAMPGSDKKTAISATRNQTFHEALFFNEPLGFSVYRDNSAPSSSVNIPLEMRNLICRLLVALLGTPACGYITSPINTRQRFSLDFS